MAVGKEAAPGIYRLRITLAGGEPAIWRQVEVPKDFTFAKLHDVIQKAMGWEDCHLWNFHVDGREVAPPAPKDDFFGSFGPPTEPANKRTLEQLLQGRRIKFRYIYDFGDDWLHEIKVEKVMPAEPGVVYPRCIGGARACPPEDCGGPPGYEYFLEALDDPGHPEHENFTDWIGGEWDPEAFDLDAVNAAMKRLAPKTGKAKKPKS
jgi:Plasmid pRiA4b ORF-3-like protein